MSETFIFVVGVIVFAVTVYGSVMAAGTALTRAELEQNPSRRQGVDEEDLKKFPPTVEY